MREKPNLLSQFASKQDADKYWQETEIDPGFCKLQENFFWPMHVKEQVK